LAARRVTLEPGFNPRPLVLDYDHLVIALGNVTGLAGLPGGQQHVVPFKSLGDALHLRNHVIHVLEEAAIETDPELRRELTTFVVAGGGFSGVEIAAELNDFVLEVVDDYKGIDPGELHVLLLHSRDRILPELSEYVAKILRAHGANHNELFNVHKLFHTAKADLEQHLIKEEEILFPLIKDYDKAPTKDRLETIRKTLGETEAEHDAVGKILKEIRRITRDYSIPEDACTTFVKTYQRLQELESDLFQHIHLENNILFRNLQITPDDIKM
jgi:iron-sulfur cluster repair protein YtfE (RIC family)